MRKTTAEVRLQGYRFQFSGEVLSLLILAIFETHENSITGFSSSLYIVA